jgi:hypothetical protein
VRKQLQNGCFSAKCSRVNDAVKRFWANVDKRGPDECWEWMASRKPTGYGQFMVSGKMKRVHRYSWELHTGAPPPADMSLCHRCDNPPCVNPAHLFVGTQKDNIQDALRKGRLHSPFRGRTHCSNGHEYTPENTAMKLGAHGHWYRICRECRLIQGRKDQMRNRERVNARKRELRALRKSGS